jgi:two-component system LytT family response regulator
MSRKINCVIVDDEQDAIDLLSFRIGQLYGNINISDTFQHWQAALAALRTNKYDLLFIDISMPGKNGLDLLKLLPGIDCEIIFVTAHDNYALKAFSFAATGYILKPIDDQELSAAVDRALERITHKTLAAQNQKGSSVVNEKIRIPGKQGIDYVNVNDILYLESINKCTQIATSNGKYLCSTNLGTYKYLTDGGTFFQVHRSFIINLNCITRYESGGVVIMQDKKEVPVARNIRHDFLRLFNPDDSK